MTDAEERARARCERMTLHKGRLGELEVLSPIFGAEAISLVHRLTLASYSLASQARPTYARTQTRHPSSPLAVRIRALLATCRATPKKTVIERARLGNDSQRAAEAAAKDSS